MPKEEVIIGGKMKRPNNARGIRLTFFSKWAIAFNEAWKAIKKEWSNYNNPNQDLASFICCLLAQRGEFGRLLLLLASVERRDYRGGSWWENTRARRRVINQLQRCLDALNQKEEL